jgi:hypothetical protein
MIKNEPVIRKMKAHLHMLHGLCEDLSGSFDPQRNTAAPLMALYGEAFNKIAIDIMPKLGLTEEEIHDLVISFLDDEAQEAVRNVKVAA